MHSWSTVDSPVDDQNARLDEKIHTSSPGPDFRFSCNASFLLCFHEMEKPHLP